MTNIDRQAGDNSAKDINAPTNADRIRSMSDEELARFLWEQNGGNRYWKSVEKYLDWLKQPLKEE